MKSGILIITLATVLLTLLLSSAISAQPKSKTWIKGTWEGAGYQTDNQSTWTMRLTARGRRFSIDYPSLDCGGRWQLISIGSYRAIQGKTRSRPGQMYRQRQRGNSAAQQKADCLPLFECGHARSNGICGAESKAKDQVVSRYDRGLLLSYLSCARSQAGLRRQSRTAWMKTVSS
jgi:hypothetical protein